MFGRKISGVRQTGSTKEKDLYGPFLPVRIPPHHEHKNAPQALINGLHWHSLHAYTKRPEKRSGACKILFIVVCSIQDFKPFLSLSGKLIIKHKNRFAPARV